MNRRDALQQLGVLALLASPVRLAQGQTESSFRVLRPPVQVYATGKIEVLEFFQYKCAHCRVFDPLLEQWAKRLPKDVAFSQIPVIWSTPDEGFARLYYTLLTTKRLDLQEKVFAAVQERKLQINNPVVVREWAGANKLDVQAFMNVYGSFGVDTQVRRAKQFVNLYKIKYVPMMAVAGRFLTSAEMAGNSHEAVLKVVDRLIERVRKGG